MEEVYLIKRVLEGEEDVSISEKNGVRRGNIFVVANRSFQSFEDGVHNLKIISFIESTDDETMVAIF